MYSIRRKLMLVFATGFAALIVGTDLYIVDEMSTRIRAEFDVALLARARALVALTEEDEGQVEFDYKRKLIPEYDRDERPEYFQFWLDDGTVLLRSPRLQPEHDLPFVRETTNGPQFQNTQLADGRPGRAVTLTFEPDLGEIEEGGEVENDSSRGPADEDANRYDGKIVLAVARGRVRLDDSLANTRLVILSAGGLAVLLAGLLIWRALVIGFRPLDSITAQVKRLDADSLKARVDLPRTPQELAPIVVQLNALLSRLDTTFDRERRFAGNVAHELRTPIAELRSLAVVGAKWPDDPASVAAFFDDVNDIAGRMESVIADLLLLARCQAGIEPATESQTSIRQLVAAAWSTLATRAKTSALRLEVDLPSHDIVLCTDAGKLAIVMTNLLGNAVAYARRGSTIRATGSSSVGRFEFEVTNEAQPMSEADLANLTEPFWRRDESRSSAEHAGLGLSLVTALLDLLGMEVRFAQSRDGTFRVHVSGPAQDTVSGESLRHIQS